MNLSSQIEELRMGDVVRADFGKKKRDCTHSSLVVETKERRVRCRDCGEVVDTFSTMEALARMVQRLKGDVKRV